MNRIGQCLSKLAAENRKALVTYIVNGDPKPEASLAAMHALVESGADIIELGVPFSDPMAEGPVIQRGHERALTHGTSLKGTMALVKEFRQTNQDTPVVLMGYANPVERMGYEHFAKQAQEAGVDGLLTVDLPAEEAEALNTQLRNHNIENIFLLAPTTTDARTERVVSLAGGFLYYVSLKGVTGAGNLDIESVKSRVNIIKQKTDLPVLVGFGIKDAASASAIGAVSDGVVVGSVLVDAMGQKENAGNDEIAQALKEILSPMRKALDELK